MRNRIVAICFISFIFLLGGLTVFRSGDALEWLKTVSSDYSKASITETEASIDDSIAYKKKWINANGLFLKAFGVTADLNKQWFLLDNDTMIYSLNKAKDEDLDYFVDNTKKLESSLPDDTQLVYVQLPFKVINDDLLPAGVNEYGNDNADSLLAEFDKESISYIDLRNEMKKDGLVHEKQFFKTDHHWKPGTAKWAAGKISSVLSDMTSWDHDPYLYADENFKTTTYKDHFLGSLGKKTGNWYAGVDDFDLLLPAYKSSFDFWADAKSGDIERSGDFEEALLDKSNLKKNYFDINTYAVYTGGDYKENTVINNYSNNHKKVLLLRDSFSCTLLPFLSLSCEQVTTLDLRYYKKMSVIDYVKKHDFDVVLIAYNPSAFSRTQFSFDGQNIE